MLPLLVPRRRLRRLRRTSVAAVSAGGDAPLGRSPPRPPTGRARPRGAATDTTPAGARASSPPPSWPIKANSHGPTCGFPVFFIARANVSSDDARRKKKREGFSSINIFGRPEKGTNMIPICSIVVLSQDLVHWQRRPCPRVVPASDLLLSCEDAANNDAFLFP